MRSKLGWKRPPVAASMRLRTYSRSRKAKKTGRDGPELHAHLAEEQRDVGDAAQLEEDRADVLGPGRGLDLHELLGGEDERHLVGERRQPVDAVDQRRDLGVRADLGELLVAAVHVAAHGVGRHDLLAVEAGDEPQGAVGGRVLRAEVEGHVLGLELDVDPGVGRLGGDVGQPLLVGDGHQPAASVGLRLGRLDRRRPRRASLGRGHGLHVDQAGPRLDLAGQQREVLAQREALELAGQVEVISRGGRRSRTRTSPTSRARASRRRGRRRARSATRGVVVVEVGLEGDADACGVVEYTPGQDLEPGVAAGARRVSDRRCRSPAPGSGSRRPRRPRRRRRRRPRPTLGLGQVWGIQSMPERKQK